MICPGYSVFWSASRRVESENTSVLVGIRPMRDSPSQVPFGPLLPGWTRGWLTPGSSRKTMDHIFGAMDCQWRRSKPGT